MSAEPITFTDRDVLSTIEINRPQRAYGVLRDHNGRYFLLRETDRKETGKVKYVLPGGELHPHEDPEVGFYREFREETGGMKTMNARDFYVTYSDVVNPQGEIEAGAIYAINVTGISGEFRANNEADNFGWFSYNQIQKDLVPSGQIDEGWASLIGMVERINIASERRKNQIH